MEGQITIRKAKKEDVDLLYRWSNEPSVRAQSFSSEEITYAEHCSWFEKKLESDNSIIFILEVNGLSASVVRFEIKDVTTIGISIDVNFRGRGLAALFLKLAVSEYFKNNSIPVMAYIKESNEASVKSFEKSGFKLLRKDKVNNIDSFVYQIAKNE